MLSEFELLMNRISSNIKKYHSMNPLEFEMFRLKYSIISNIFYPSSFDLVYKATMNRVFNIRSLNDDECTIHIKDKHFCWQCFNKLNDDVWISYNNTTRDIDIDDKLLEILTVLGIVPKLYIIDNRKSTVIEFNS